jgi:pyruvate/2-oxoacid:ferredoxin oxidoreductase alpha subunit
MDRLGERTRRRYGLVEYVGAADAARVVVLMESGMGAAAEAVEALVAAGEPVGLLKVRPDRPFPAEQLVATLPPTVRSIAVLDRTKEPGALGEPSTSRSSPPWRRLAAAGRGSSPTGPTSSGCVAGWRPRSSRRRWSGRPR